MTFEKAAGNHSFMLILNYTMCMSTCMSMFMYVYVCVFIYVYVYGQ